MGKENKCNPNSNNSHKILNNRIFLEFLVSFIVYFSVIIYMTANGLIREVYEVYNNSIISFVLLFTAYIIYREFRFRLVSLAILIMSLVYFLEWFEEIFWFAEDGVVDKIEDFFADYIMLISVAVLLLGFVVITKRKDRKIVTLKHTSLHDSLTGIYNRRALLQLYGDEMITESVTFCYIDLDGFKEINDRHGHDTGDRILRDFAEILTRYKRSSDQFFRLGGDEFVLVVDTMELEVAGGIIERFRSLVRDEIRDYEVDFTYGLVPVHCDMTLGEVLRRADTVMYKNKSLRKR